ncbi:2OG-Fe dioxygenase family protein [Parasalinivibrio latis]|uniref:2OG-Fe dioxygenase family protein n=1 Tax=Parasalinivibrio latis TaxID=2952610 RepID=UPI0030E10ACA
MVEMGHRYSYILNVTQLLILDVGFNEDENMGTDKATLVNLSNLENTSVIEMQPFFDRLPQTAHADGTYRLRRYSIVKFHHGFLEILPESNFVQSSEVNHFQGDVIREFDGIERSLLESDAMHAVCKLFAENTGLTSGNKIEIHQIRILADGNSVPSAPEGIHQDGFSHVAIVAINRENAAGGEFQVFRSPDSSPILNLTLDNGEVALVDDHSLWHYASPLKPIDNNKPAIWDLFVLTTRGDA